mgnify:CR=1 FL=1
MKFNNFLKTNSFFIILIIFILLLMILRKILFTTIEGLRSKRKKNRKKKRFIKKNSKKIYSITPYGRNKRCGFFTSIRDLIMLLGYLVGLPGLQPNYKNSGEWMRITRRFKQSKRFCRWEKKEAELQYYNCIKKKKGCPPLVSTTH